MKELVVLPRFARDLRRYKRSILWSPAHKAELDHLFELFVERDVLPPHYRVHPLQAEYAGYTECHLDEDWLLIYRVLHDRVVVCRTGTHRELFNRRR